MNTSHYYYLGFAFSNEKKGLSQYCSYIKVDELGNIIEDIKFPNKSKYINDLVSVYSVKKKAIKRDFYKEEKTKIKLEFNQKRNIFEWKFINEYYKPDHTYLTMELIYNAHNGNYIKNQTKKGFWVE